ncbi:MAG TPA: 3-dehydroquinate synthase [Gemmatimonadaceae bacterium]|nr:3-dehydroquinate synthase [Gemmatimonadaceae bacterium]
MVALPYPIEIAAGALDGLSAVVRAVGANRVAVITDSEVGPRYGARVMSTLGLSADTLFTIPAGEEHKTRETWARLTDELLARGFGRDTTVVALGGGVVGDIAGFVAATYMRGVPVVQVPTSLLAMVDASVGGKTGVDAPAGKNLVGAFHQPSAVVIDPTVLRTLPEAHLRAGFAEILKHGVIADAGYFEQSSRFLTSGAPSSRSDLDELTRLIRRSVEIKASIVASDEREAGLRKVLNFGHTIGHAVEAATHYRTLHGQAVAIGLVAEARLSERLGIGASGIARDIEDVCRAAGLPTAIPDLPVDALLGFTHADKKARKGRVEYALPARIGAMAGAERGWTIAVDDETVRAVLAS